MFTIYTGPAPFALLVQEKLRERRVVTEVHRLSPLGAVSPSAFVGASGWHSVVVTAGVAERFRAEIEEVLALVSPPEPAEVVPAPAPRARGDEPVPTEAESEAE